MSDSPIIRTMSNLASLFIPVLLIACAGIIWQIYKDNQQWNLLIEQYAISAEMINSVESRIDSINNALNQVQAQMTMIAGSIVTRADLEELEGDQEKFFVGFQKDLDNQRQRLYMMEVKYLQAVPEAPQH